MLGMNFRIKKRLLTNVNRLVYEMQTQFEDLSSFRCETVSTDSCRRFGVS